MKMKTKIKGREERESKNEWHQWTDKSIEIIQKKPQNVNNYSRWVLSSFASFDRQNSFLKRERIPQESLLMDWLPNPIILRWLKILLKND